MPDQKSVIIVAGPTASGKTDTALSLAEKHNTSIISADSRQCYTEMNIGVAKPSVEILNTVRHYFINSHSIFDDVSARTFEFCAMRAAEEIFRDRTTAVMAGGTGLYIRAFMNGLDDIPEVSLETETRIREDYKSKGIAWLAQELNERDPLFAAMGEMQNPQRMMRALAVNISTGKSILDYHAPGKKERPFRIEKIYIDIPREILYGRINDRVEEMMSAGLLEEVKSLYPCRHLNALQTVGYSELFDYLENKTSLTRAVELIKQHSRHYAKRQMTWFRKYFVDENTVVIKQVSAAN